VQLLGHGRCLCVVDVVFGIAGRRNASRGSRLVIVFASARRCFSFICNFIIIDFKWKKRRFRSLFCSACQFINFELCSIFIIAFFFISFSVVITL
jgi:hypothetical protein